MSGIYRGASRVLVWLGELENENDLVFEFLTDVEREFGLV
jgi:hypothetical protein